MPPLLSSSSSSSSETFASLRRPLTLRSFFPSIQKLAPHSDASLIPTRTLPPLNPIPRSLASLFRRQTTTVTATSSVNPIIPATYAGLNAGPPPGEVVGIVFGSVAAFLLVLWIIYTCFNFRGGGSSSIVEEETVVRRHSRSPSRRRSSPRRSSPRRPPSTRSASEVIEARSTRERTPPPRRESRRETVIIEETRRPARQEDDIVEVIEEHSPVRRESRKKSGGFRTVDPEAFGGGSRPFRKVNRR